MNNDANHQSPGEPSGDLASVLGGKDDSRGGGPLDIGPDDDRHARKQKTNTSVALLALVIVVTGASLYFMRRVALRSGVSFTNVKIDYPVGSTEQLANDYRAIISDLRTGANFHPVPLSQLRSDPFRLDLTTDDPEALAKMLAEQRAQELEDQRRKEQERRGKIKDQLAALELNSIVGGSKPMARISGRLVRSGDTVGDMFVVRAIHARSVDLDADGERYTITMSDDDQ